MHDRGLTPIVHASYSRDAQSRQRPTIGKWLKRALKPVALSTASRTAVELLGRHRVIRAAALAHEVLALAPRAHVAAGAVAEVHVLDEPEPLERLEVAVDRREIGGRQLAEALRDLLGAERLVGRVEGLEHDPARHRDAQAARAQRRDCLGQRLGLHARTRMRGGHRARG